MSPTVYLVSGANRGLGFALVESLASRPNTVIFAGARDPSKATALEELSKAHPGVFHIVKLESTSRSDAEKAAAAIIEAYGKVDVVIANAGISNNNDPVATISLDVVREHYEVNALGPLILFQATHALLSKSDTGAPKFVLISSVAGSKTLNLPYPLTPYGSSKAAANFFLGSELFFSYSDELTFEPIFLVMHNEHKDLIILATQPGLIPTDMGINGAKSLGIDECPDSIEEGVVGILKVIDEAKREDKVIFKSYTGEIIPW
ncbi:short-chain dehydrogenase/reductase SDR family protein [Pseudohyphozyma bogoriensis]|nr:short-chain dehydrogenase/reductase SDR family protein [Pseudohyphozyma bogoriensis]